MRTHFLKTHGLRLAAAIGATLVLVSSGSTSWSAERDTRDHVHWSWSGPIATGRTLEINGVNGQIVAEPSSGANVEVMAEKYGRRSNPEDVKIKVVQDSEGITICAVYPGEGNACDAGDYHSHTHDNDVRVDFRVKVPAGVAFSAHTVNGGVTAHSLSGPIKASTVNGGCDIETSHGGTASTVNGDVHATLGQVPSGESLGFSTVNGGITLRLPANVNAELEGSTVNGGIETDFPVTTTGRWGPKRMHGTVGHGGARLKASTVNGSIRFERAN